MVMTMSQTARANAIKVSVLVPVYNTARYLVQCLNSLIAQTLTAIEIICINDGSTDASLAILQQFQQRDPRIIIINKPNSGYGDSMNQGLQRAQGEYIAILESDDFARPEMLATLYGLAIANATATQGVDLVRADFFYYTEKTGATTQTGVRPAIIRKAGRIYNRGQRRPFTAAQYPAILRLPPAIWSGLYRREFLIEQQIGFLPTPGASYQDTSFAFKTLALAQSIIFTSAALLYYRTDNPHSSVKAADKIWVICKEHQEIDRFLRSHPELSSFAQYSHIINQYKGYLWSAWRIDAAYRDAFIVYFAQVFRQLQAEGKLPLRFYLQAGWRQLHWLLHNPIRFRRYVDGLAQRHQATVQRRQRFSIRLHYNMISIILFGKQLVELH